MNPLARPRLATHFVAALSLIALLILTSCFVRQLNGHGWDFNAYFKAGARWVRGESPYFYERDFSFKYAPVLVLPFSFFQLFSFDTARWIYAALHAFVALSLPYVLYRVLEKDPLLKLIERPDAFAMGILVAFLGTLRFIDGEFHTSQIGLWIAWTLLAGIWILQNTGHRRAGRAAGLALLSLASLTKIHSAVFLVCFAKKKSYGTLAWVLGIFLLVAMLPDPSMWIDWVAQIRRTTFDLPMDSTSVNLQGFYPFGVLRLGMSQFSAWPLLLALPFAIIAAFATSRFSLRELRAIPTAALLSISVWLLLGFMASPLPWQYTYSILWMIVPLAWIASDAKERCGIVAVELFLGLSPQGIIGKTASMGIESRQSTFFAVLVFWMVLTRQAYRWRPPATDPLRRA